MDITNVLEVDTGPPKWSIDHSMGLVWILLALALVIGAAWIVRRAKRMECYRDASTGELWEPRFLIVMFQGSAHRSPEGEMLHGTGDVELDDDEKERVFCWGDILATAQAYGIPVEEIPSVAQYGCNWCRVFDFKGAPKRRREVIYAMASMLIEQCREADVSACARIVGERDARPFGVNSFLQFLENAKLSDGVFLELAHANIPELANRETVLHRLLKRRVSPNEYLDGTRWLVGDSRRVA